MQNKIIYRESRDIQLCIVALLAFIVVPLLGVAIMLVANLGTRSISRVRLMFFFLLLACYLGAVNATKLPVSDQWHYWMAYQEVPKLGFVGSLYNIYGTDFYSVHTSALAKDMGFGLLNYVGYYLSFGCYPFFILLFSTLLYFIVFYSIYRFYVSTEHEWSAKKRVLSGVVLIAFFTQYFNLTIHLQRQEIAVAVMMLAIVLFVATGRINWLLTLAALSLHSSVFIFLPLFLFAKFIVRRSRKWIACMLGGIFVVLLALMTIAQNLLNTLGGDTLFILNRLANQGETDEERMSLGLVLFLGIPMLYIALKKIFFQKNIANERERIIHLTYIVIMLFVLVTPDNVMQYRYFMLTYIFVPLSYPLLAKETPFDKAWLFVIPAFMVFRFFITFEDIVYEYAPIEDILLSNPFSLLFYRT